MNEALFRFFNSTIRNPLFDMLMPLFSDKDCVVIPAIALLALGFYMGSRHRRVMLAALIVAIAVANTTSEKMLKPLFGAKRPYAVLDDVHLHRSGQWLLYDEQSRQQDSRRSNSFPSSHAANAAAAAVALAFMTRRSLWVTVPLAAMVGLSRVYTGNHFPVDVLGGWAWGSACGLGSAAFLPRLVRRIAGPEIVEHPPRALGPERKAFLVLLSTWTLVNFAFVGLNAFTLSGDEAQYWDWSRRLALGYYSKPPLIAYLIRLLVGAGGNKEWAIRAGAVLLSSGTLAFVHALTLRIARSERAALTAAIVTVAMPAAWAGSVLITPDAALLFCWAWAMYAFHRAVAGDGCQWGFVGLALGLGLLAKYTTALLGTSLLAYLIVVDRRWLRKPGPYVAGAIALACLSGVMYWNWANDWISLRHTASIGALDKASAAKSLAQLGEFVGGQIGVIASPMLFGFFAWTACHCAKWWRVSRDAAFLTLCFGVLAGFYTLVSLFNRTEPNWPVCAYIPLAAGFGWLWNESPRMRKAQWALAGAVLLGCFLGMCVRSTGVLYLVSAATSGPGEGDNRIHLGPLEIDPDADPTNELRGARELATALSKHACGKSGPFIFSNRYQMTAQMAFYVEGRPRTYCINIDRRYNQYDLWGGWDELKGRDGLFVTGGDESQARFFIEVMVQLGVFQGGEYLEAVEVRRADTLIQTYTISRMTGFTGNLPKPKDERF